MIKFYIFSDGTVICKKKYQRIGGIKKSTKYENGEPVDYYYYFIIYFEINNFAKITSHEFDELVNEKAKFIKWAQETRITKIKNWLIRFVKFFR